MTIKKLKPYLVFSTTRDIFFGWATDTGPRMTLKRARRIFSYPKHPLCGGPDALAIYGAFDGVKAGPETIETIVESVANCVLSTKEAAESWSKKTSW